MRQLIDPLGGPLFSESQARPSTRLPEAEGDARARARALKAKIAQLERGCAKVDWGVTALGDPRLDSRLPGGGLARGRWHEIAGEGLERELPAAAAGFAAALARKAAGGRTILWALARDDLHAPGLQTLGIPPDQLILVRGDRDADGLAVIEDALRTRGIGAVVGEIGAIDLAAGKRLGLACERGGATAFVLRRRLYGKREEADGSAAATRWRIAPAPSAPCEPGIGPPRWTARLVRCRGGRTGAWILECGDDPDTTPGDVRVVAELADHAVEATDGRGLSGRPARARDGGDGGQRAASGGGG